MTGPQTFKRPDNRTERLEARFIAGGPRSLPAWELAP